VTWTTYLLRCSDASLYCGATIDLENRVRVHNAGKGARYTRSRGPVEVVAFRPGLTKSQALRLEAAVKRVPRDKKVDVLRSAVIG
jgi:putative endonuclease